MHWLKELVATTVFQTVLAGTLIFLAGEIIVRFILEPARKFKEVVGKIDNRLKFYDNIYGGLTKDTPDYYKDRLLNIIDEIRELSCEFESVYKQIPAKWFFIFVGTIPARKDASDAARCLIRLSNLVASYEDHNKWEVVDGDRDKIRQVLRIPSL